MGWDISQPYWRRCHVQLDNERGVVLVFKPGHDLPQFADRLTRVQRLLFWQFVQQWVELEKGNRDKTKKSDAKQSNENCVNRDGTAELKCNNSRGR